MGKTNVMIRKTMVTSTNNKKKITRIIYIVITPLLSEIGGIDIQNNIGIMRTT